jgi:hypothetical protein
MISFAIAGIFAVMLVSGCSLARFRTAVIACRSLCHYRLVLHGSLLSECTRRS